MRLLCSAFVVLALSQVANAQSALATLDLLQDRGAFSYYQGRISQYTNVLASPTVSPYVSFGQNARAPNSYYTYARVRVALEGRRESLRQQSRLTQLSPQIQALSTAPARYYNPYGVTPTGHPSRTRSYSHYYRGLAR